jgi:hypothetical protein
MPNGAGLPDVISGGIFIQKFPIWVFFEGLVWPLLELQFARDKWDFTEENCSYFQVKFLKQNCNCCR